MTYRSIDQILASLSEEEIEHLNNLDIDQLDDETKKYFTRKAE